MMRMDIRASALIMGGFYTCTPAWTVGEDFYMYSHRLYFPRVGKAEFSYPGRTWTLEPGYIYLLPGYQWVRSQCERRLTLDWIHFRPESLEMDYSISKIKQGLRWRAREWSYWKPIYTRMAELFKSHPPKLVCQTQAMLLWAFSELVEPALPSRDARGAAAFQQVQTFKPALEFMDQHFAENPLLKEVAASVHLSPIYFHRCFSQTFHIAPRTYLLRKRMNHAWELLRNGRASVTETADQLNFSSPFYFSRAFKRFFGITPVQVRTGRLAHQP